MRKQISLLALSTLFGLGVAMASPQTPEQAAPQDQIQNNGRHARQQDPAKQVKHLAKRLNLTADQQNQLLPIFADRQQQMAAIRGDSSLAPKDRMAKARALREDSENKIKAVLTDSQKQAYDQLQQQMRARRQGRQPSAPGVASNS
jgi:hypothetical protein